MSRKYDYIICLKKEKSAFNIFITVCLLALGNAFLLLLAGNKLLLQSDYSWQNLLSTVVVLAVAVWAVYYFLIKRKKEIPGSKPFFALAIAFLFFLYPLSWGCVLAGLYVFLGILLGVIKNPQEVLVDRHGVGFNTIPAKSYAWAEISNMLIKDNLLTIDFVNNRLIQVLIEGEVDKSLEEELNAFCKRHIKKDTSGER